MGQLDRRLKRVIMDLEDIRDEARFVDPDGKEKMERAINDLNGVYLLDPY